jgi:hypothetical protein
MPKCTKCKKDLAESKFSLNTKGDLYKSCEKCRKKIKDDDVKDDDVKEELNIADDNIVVESKKKNSPPRKFQIVMDNNSINSSSKREEFIKIINLLKKIDESLTVEGFMIS